MVAVLLAKNGYSLQGNQKTKEGTRHPDRNAQFEYISAQATAQFRAGEPNISVDSKKKELVGEFKNGGKEWRPFEVPEKVRVHDFLIPENGKAIPYEVYDLKRYDGWVSVGIDHETASFAVRSIGRWWRNMGRTAYSQARSLLITAYAGGSNSPRVRLWKWSSRARGPDSPFTCSTSPPGRASGTKSSIGSPRSSRRTGGGDPLRSGQ